MKFIIVKDKEFYRNIGVIMLPVALQQGINMGVNMLDTMMVGSLGEIQLSASSLANQYYSLFTILCMGIIGGASVLAAQYWGMEDKDKARETFSMAFRLAVGVSVLFAAVTWLFPRQIMSVYTSEEGVIEEGVKYLSVIRYVFLLHGCSQVYAFLMRSVGQAKLGLFVSVVSFFVNFFFNYVFIFGHFGFPRLEIVGAGIGTLIARFAEFMITFIFILFVDESLGLRIKHILKSPSPEFYKNYFRLGAPVLISDTMLGVGNNMVSVVLGHMGSGVVAANSICMVVDQLCTVMIQGVSNAASIVTGQTIGRGETEKALAQGETFYLVSIVLGALAAVLVFIFGPMTMRFYNLTSETIVITQQLMKAYVFVVFFQCIQSVMTKGVLRGGGDTKFLMKADVMFLWAVSIPLGAFSGLMLGLPAWVTLLCLKIDLAIKSFWCIRRLLSGKWIRRVERTEEP